MTIAGVTLAGAGGALTWSFLEYVIHRWAGHDRRTYPNLFSAEHIRHHSQGDYFAPAWKKGLAALIVAGLLSGPAVLLGGAWLGLSYVGGLVGLYLAYEWLHLRLHTHAPIGPYGRWARRHHFFHHFHDPSRNHGVTSPLWDLVFGTHSPPEQVRVPEKLAMRWLCDPESGEVHAAWAADYALRRRKRRAPALAGAAA